MKNRSKILKILLFVVMLILFLSSCRKNPTGPASVQQKGSAKINIIINKVGMLSKKNDVSDITLKNLLVTLSADGEGSVYDTIPLPHDGGATVSSTYENLIANKTWTVFVKSSDINDSTIHAGSTSFNVLPDQTTPVTLDLTAIFSELAATLYPIKSFVNRAQIIVDGKSVVDSTFSSTSISGDTLGLKYDYLTTAMSHDITFNVYGNYGGNNTLLYTGSRTLSVMPGENITYLITLNWVGPVATPTGAGTINVVLGSVGNVVVKGELSDSIANKPTQFSGSITKKTTWSLSGSPYTLTGDVTISSLATLTIEQGVVIQGQGYSIKVSGMLLVNGASNSTVIFNNTKIIPASPTTGKHYFVGIHFAELNSCQLFNSRAGYGKGSLILQDSRLIDVSYILIGAPVADCYIERNIFMNCDYITTELKDTANCFIRNNIFFKPIGTCAVQNQLNDSTSTGQTVVEYNSFLSTDKIAVALPGGSETANLSAINNYWNTTDENIIAGMIYDMNDDSTCSGYIEYKPFLTAPDPGTPTLGN